MARYRGTFTAAANYEPLKAAPFDARSLVECKADLINPATWMQDDTGDIWTYVGMMVTVAQDIDDNNNGVYILTGEDFTQSQLWRKCADERDIARLLEEIENIDVSGEGSLDVTVDSDEALPEVGDANTTYYIKADNSIQRWDEDTQRYIRYGGSDVDPDLDIQLIHGGNANGTD
jgi:hypothetical protein